MGVKQFVQYELPGKIDDLNNDLSLIGGDVSNLSDSIDTELGELQEAIDGQITGLDTSLTGVVNQTKADLTGLINALDGQVNAVSAAVSQSAQASIWTSDRAGYLDSLRLVVPSSNVLYTRTSTNTALSKIIPIGRYQAKNNGIYHLKIQCATIANSCEINAIVLTDEQDIISDGLLLSEIALDTQVINTAPSYGKKITANAVGTFQANVAIMAGQMVVFYTWYSTISTSVSATVSILGVVE